jgi:hypothetical protein
MLMAVLIIMTDQAWAGRVQVETWMFRRRCRPRRKRD